MSKKEEFIISKNQEEKHFGISMKQLEHQKIKKRLSQLEDRCPSQCSIKLSFEKRRSSIVGKLSISSIPENFHSRKVGHSPYQIYDLLEGDIDQQLRQWKRRRFSSSLEKTINPENSNSQSA